MSNRNLAKKILCTLGPASLNPKSICRLDELGVDLFRLNLSHTSLEQLKEFVELVRRHSSIPICLDTQGAQVRTGELRGKTLILETHSVVELIGSPELGHASQISLYPASILPQLGVGDLLHLDFDAALLQILSVGSKIFARVLNGGVVGSNKAVTIDRAIPLPPLTAVDEQAVAIGMELGLRHVALSFANAADDVEILRRKTGPNVTLIAKIESRKGLKNLTPILDVADAILIDRGDLSREVLLEHLPLIQKKIISEANKKHIPVYVATNLLESMVVHGRPTRAEVNDVMNTLLDGADGLVLAAETAIGKHPIECASMIRGLIHQYQASVSETRSSLSVPFFSPLMEPHGGKLVDRLCPSMDEKELNRLPSIEISDQTLLDARQMALGTFSPLEGFMGREEMENVLAHYRLPNGTVWPLPILLQNSFADSKKWRSGEVLALSCRGQVRALLHLEETFHCDLEKLATQWFGTSDRNHPGVANLMDKDNSFLAGKVDLLEDDFKFRQPFEMTPSQTRSIFYHRSWQKVVGFHTRNVAHRAHEYLVHRALNRHYCDGVFVYPVVGPKKSGDYLGDIILKSYSLLIGQYYPPHQTLLAGSLNYARYAGPREALFTALCHKNFGCSHFIVGRDHTGVGNYYASDASQKLLDTVGDIGIQIISFDEVVYCEQCGEHVEHCSHDRRAARRISGTEARETLKKGKTLPEWYMRGSVSSLILNALEKGTPVFEGET